MDEYVYPCVVGSIDVGLDLSELRKLNSNFPHRPAWE